MTTSTIQIGGEYRYTGTQYRMHGWKVKVVGVFVPDGDGWYVESDPDEVETMGGIRRGQDVEVVGYSEKLGRYCFGSMEINARNLEEL